ncbi:Uncharacterised protein [Achromobacter xylosoxidans]|uniref:hypothetical protein n=1 Tax=Alcaligenes xylosoxydans xylosoxydans TaxID=85698 RepID=UPI0006C4A2E7|nr:hypothetical protein [Achromobacter xylosoxidans]CUJ61611.1 Uncharacterised protein [Achromobacter xylosoxidans]
MAKVFLLISEGPTDFYVIRKFAARVEQVVGDKIEIRLLSPEIDATTGKYEAHGWGGVKDSCERHRVKSDAELAHLIPAIRERVKRQNWRNHMVASGAEGLIIQMDSDVAEYIDSGRGFDPKVIHRKEYSEQVVLRWIGEPSQGKDLYLAVTNMALETWILASHERSHQVFADLPAGFKFGDIADVEARLLALGFAGVMKKGKRRLSKAPATRYEAYGDLVASQLERITAECECAAGLFDYLERQNPGA